MCVRCVCVCEVCVCEMCVCEREREKSEMRCIICIEGVCVMRYM